MKLNLISTSNLGDFLNAIPVLSGIVKSTDEKIDLIIRSETRKFMGFREFLMYQDLFNSVEYSDTIFSHGIKIISSWTREDKNNPNRPIETCRYENFMKDNYRLEFDVDDDFIIKVPELDIDIKDTYYVGDRWSVGDIDARRETNVLSHLSNFTFIDYDNDILTNAYIIKNLKKPFITNLTGVSILADLLNVESYVVWKAEDWKPEFRKGDNIDWDNGKDINTIFEKHFYLNRKTKLIHANELNTLL